MRQDDSAPIDWEAVWQRLDWGLDRRLEAIETTLTERTVRYAQPPEGEDEAALETVPALIFVRGQARYAVPVLHVVQGLDAPSITPVPCTPAYFRGVVHLRGRMTSVLDLNRLSASMPRGLPADSAQDRPPGIPAASGPPGPSKLLIVRDWERAAGLQIALLADDLLDVAHLPARDIAPPSAASVAMDHVQGITPDGIVILDVESLLQDPRLIVDEEP